MLKNENGVGGLVLKNGYLKVIEIDHPDELRAGETATIDIRVRNNANIIRNNDPDVCKTMHEGREVNGYDYTVVVNPGWTGSASSTGCIKTQPLSGYFREQEHTFSVTAPSQSGTHSITYSLRVNGSGEARQMTRTVSVSGGEGGGSGVPAEPIPDPSPDPSPPPSNNGGQSGVSRATILGGVLIFGAALAYAGD